MQHSFLTFIKHLVDEKVYFCLVMKNRYFAGRCILLILVACIACKPQSNSKYIIMATWAGDIEIELFPEKAPKTVAAFLSYMDSGFYEKSAFYRILSRDNQATGANAAELIQGGVYLSEVNRDYLPGIPHESTSQTGLKHQHGTLSMARQEPGTATTEFFICIGENPGFDFGGKSNPDGQGYAAFGRVVRGMDVVMKIYERPERDQEFTPPVLIKQIFRK